MYYYDEYKVSISSKKVKASSIKTTNGGGRDIGYSNNVIKR